MSRHALRLLGADRLRAAPMLGVLVEAELAGGDISAAEAAATHLAVLASETPALMVAAHAALAAGHVARHRDNLAAAVAAYESGADLLSPGDWPLLCAGLRLNLAEVHVEKDVATAVVEARAALAIYVGIGSPFAERAAALLRRLGEPDRAPAPAPTALDILTRRERDVFDLMAEHLTNPEIGRRLGVTAKTVEHHVGNVLGKLGMRGRAEAAVYAMTIDRTDPVPPVSR